MSSPMEAFRPRPTPTRNASSAISRTDGASHTGLWPCARKATRGTESRGDRAIPVVRNQPVQIQGLRNDMKDPIYFVVWFYGQRGGAENLIKEANNDAGLAAHPSRRFDVNGNHFQLAMLAYNLNCWLMLFNREPQADATALKHTTLATSRLRFLFVAAKIWRHAGRTGVSYSDHYEEKGVFERLMDRLRRIELRAEGAAPVMVPALR